MPHTRRLLLLAAVLAASLTGFPAADGADAYEYGQASRDGIGKFYMGREISQWLADRHPTPTEALASSELAVLVRGALSELSTEYEVLLTAKYVDGFTAREIAVAEEMTLEAVRSKLARARETFRRLYEQPCSSKQLAPNDGSHES